VIDGAGVFRGVLARDDKLAGFVAVLDARQRLVGYITTDSLAKFAAIASIWQEHAAAQGTPASVLQHAKGHL
jgi:hypothetical protein